MRGEKGISIIHRLLHALFAALTVFVFLLFVWQHVRIVLTSTVQFDDAFIANVAKNLALGNGYAASYYGLQPFHIEITTGPTLVVPTAVLIALFGNEYWVPNLAYTLIVAVVMAALLVMLHRRVTGRAFTVSAFIAGLTMFAIGRQEIGLLGEVPAAMLIGLAALVAVSSDRDSILAVELAGLAFGLALLAKTVSLLALPAFAIVMMRMDAYERGRARSIRGFLVGAAVPLTAFEAWKFASLGTIEWIALTSREFADIFGSAADLSGSATVYGFFRHPLLPFRNAVDHSIVLARWFGGSRSPLPEPIWLHGWIPLGALAAATATAVWASQRLPVDRATTRLRAAGYTLLLTGGISVAWWLALAPMGWIRHVLPGTVCLFLGLAVLIGTVARYDLWTSAAAGTLVLAALAPNLVDVSAPFTLYYQIQSDIEMGGPQRRARLEALRVTTKFLAALEQEDPDAQLVGCGWSHNPSLEYLLPGSDHFRDCLQTKPDAVDGRRLILVRGEYFNQLGSSDIRRFQDWCERKVIFRALAWVVSECDGLPPRGQIDQADPLDRP